MTVLKAYITLFPENVTVYSSIDYKVGIDGFHELVLYYFPFVPEWLKIYNSTVEEIAAGWKENLEGFIALRKQYLLYT